MNAIRYLTHPEVVVDPGTAVPQWELSALGVARARAMLRQPWMDAIGRIVSSDETKAIQTARIVADHLGLDVEIRSGIGENDRSATGFVPPEEFERLADAFFSDPESSVSGWETARDAQDRIATGLSDLLAGPHEGDDADVAVVGHGGVGTLWWCRLTGNPIDRRHDQPGQGHYFSIDRSNGARVLHPWRAIDEISGPDPGGRRLEP